MAEYICPNCGKPIYDDEALLCLYCGESLRRPVGLLGKMKYGIPMGVLIGAVVFVVVVFALLMTL